MHQVLGEYNLASSPRGCRQFGQYSSYAASGDSRRRCACAVRRAGPAPVSMGGVVATEACHMLYSSALSRISPAFCLSESPPAIASMRGPIIGAPEIRCLQARLHRGAVCASGRAANAFFMQVRGGRFLRDVSHPGRLLKSAPKPSIALFCACRL